MQRESLRAFGYCMFASMLQYLEPFVFKYGRDHAVVTKLCEHAAKFKLTYDTLVEWGTKVMTRWQLDNAEALRRFGNASANVPAPAMAAMQQKVSALSADNKVLTAQVATLSASLAAVQVTGVEMLQLLRQLVQSSNASSPTSAVVAALSHSYEDTSGDFGNNLQKRARMTGSSNALTSNSDSALPILSQLETVKQPPNALSLLKDARAPGKFSGSTSDISIFSLYSDRFKHDEQPMNFRYDGTQQARSRLRAVVLYTMPILAENPELQQRLMAKPPPLTSPLWSVHNQKHNEACLELQKLVGEIIHNITGVKMHAFTVSSFSSLIDRITAAKKVK